MNREQSMNIDQRQLQRLMRMPEFVASLSPESYKTAQYRNLTAKWPVNTRIVYDAVQEGITSLDSLPVATGLTDKQVRGAVAFLAEKGVVSGIEVSSPK